LAEPQVSASEALNLCLQPRSLGRRLVFGAPGRGDAARCEPWVEQTSLGQAFNVGANRSHQAEIILCRVRRNAALEPSGTDAAAHTRTPAGLIDAHDIEVVGAIDLVEDVVRAHARSLDFDSEVGQPRAADDDFFGSFGAALQRSGVLCESDIRTERRQ
jgi:hypothetical protein